MIKPHNTNTELDFGGIDYVTLLRSDMVRTADFYRIFDAYRQQLQDKDVRVGPVLNHDENGARVCATAHPGVYVRSLYFQASDVIMLAFACWTKKFGRRFRLAAER